MQIQRTLVVLLVVLAFGPALAVGSVAGQTGSIDAQQTAAVSDANTAVSCEYPMELEDASGETVEIDEEPEEVVVLSAELAQHMWELGAQDKVVGMPVEDWTAYLDGSEEKTDVTNFGQPDTETVVGLEADLVLTGDITADAVEELRGADQTVFQYDVPGDLGDILDSVELTGQLVGECESAETVTAELQDRIGAVAEAAPDEPVNIYYHMGEFDGDLWTVGENTVENDLMTTAGGNNIATEADQPGYFTISEEIVTTQNPEWIVMGEGGEIPDRPGFQGSTASESDQIIQVNSNFISQHGPKTIDVLEQIGAALETEAVENGETADDATGDDGAADADGETDETDSADTTADDDADDSGPGLTAGAAVAALVALALVAARRD